MFVIGFGKTGIQFFAAESGIAADLPLPILKQASQNRARSLHHGKVFSRSSFSSISRPLINDIVRAKPRRIIFKLGAANNQAAKADSSANIEIENGCTLVWSGAGTFRLCFFIRIQSRIRGCKFPTADFRCQSRGFGREVCPRVFCGFWQQSNHSPIQSLL
jgi:hypothetical protein